MKKVIQRMFSVLLMICMLASSIGVFAYGEAEACEGAAPQEGDVLIADFGAEDAANEIVNWTTRTGKWDSADLSNEVYRNGKTQSLKWDNMGSSGKENAINTRLMSPTVYTIDKVVANKYLYAWIYSDNATTTAMNILIQDAQTGMYHGLYGSSQLLLDWQGWRLVKVDVSNITDISDFNKPATSTEAEKVASATDKFYVNLQTSGWSADGLRDPETKLYVDSVWFSNIDWHSDEAYNNFVIADFSDGEFDISQWMRSNKRTDVTSNQWKWNNEKDYSNEQTRQGKEKALKWENIYGLKDDGTYEAKNTCIESPVLGAINLGQTLEYNYINAWIYSEKATGQKIQFHIGDRGNEGTGKDTNNGNNCYKVIGEVDWTGWKLVSVGISGLKLSDFNRSSANHTATDDCKVVFSIRAGSNGITGTSADTLMYIDSFWLSKENPIAVPANEDNANLIFSIENNAESVDVTENIISITTDNGVRFATENVGNYKTAFTVKKNGTDVSASGYYVQTEGDRGYIVFNGSLDVNAEYAISWNELTMNDSRKANAGALRFKTEGAADYGFSINNRVVNSISESTGKLTARVLLINSSAAPKTVKMLVAVYDANKRLVNASIGEEYTIAAGDKVNVTASADDVTLANGMFARAYVWSMDNYVPFTAFGELK